MLALMAVQRQTAASRSRRPWMREQHGVLGGEPMVTLSKEPSKSAQTPNLRASLGQVPWGVGFGLGLGQEPQLRQEPQALTREKKRKLTARRSASDAERFEAISQSKSFLVILLVAVTLKLLASIMKLIIEDGEVWREGWGFIGVQSGGQRRLCLISTENKLINYKKIR